jgi:acetoin utilization deacetylase AcuC-like enzyme
LKVVYSPKYHIDIGPHVFPTIKYQRIHARLLEAGIVSSGDVVEPQPASWEELARVHTTAYLDELLTGSLSVEALAQLQLPWSAGMVDGFRSMAGGTFEAACLACGVDRDGLKTVPYNRDAGPGLQAVRNNRDAGPGLQTGPSPGIICHIGGGLHHAFANHGEGFCPFNDVAMAVRLLQTRGIERIAIVDLDVHHGNGTAFIFESDRRVFTFSMHQQHNYPMWKPRGSLDIGLPDGAGDDRVLRDLEAALPAVMASAPQCVFYLAGADPYDDDQLGGLRMTREGLRRRDRLVIGTVRAADLPLVVLLAGGYARNLEDTVAIHVGTIEEANVAAVRSATSRTPSSGR